MENNNGENEKKERGEVGKELSALQDELKTAAKALEEARTANTTLVKKIGDSESVYSNPDFMTWLEEKEKGEGGGSKERGDEMDLDRASGTELVSFLTEKMTSAFDKQTAGMEKVISQLSDRVAMLGNKVDFEFVKIRDPDFIPFSSSEEGEKILLEKARENPTWGAQKLWDDVKKDKMIASHVEQEEKEGEEEKERQAWSEKPEMARELADEDANLTDEEIAEKSYDSSFGKGVNMDDMAP